MQIREEKLEESYSSTEPQQVISIPPKQQYNIPTSTESIPSEMRIHQLNYEIAWMKNRIQELENQFSLLKEIIEDPLSEISIIDIREITIKEAKKIILEFYESHDTQSIYPSEVADELGLDLETTAKAIDELLKEEKLEVVNE
jgi:DNA-binding MarR family transcriptional regulator